MRYFLQQLGQGRLMGHPFHVMVVHFPSALFPTGLIMDVCAWWLTSPQLALVAFAMLACGLAGGCLAAFFGALDYLKLQPGHKARSTATWHALLNVLWLTLFGIIVGLRWESWHTPEPAHYPYLIIEVVSVLGLLISNFLGGELVLRHGVGKLKENTRD